MSLEEMIVDTVSKALDQVISEIPKGDAPAVMTVQEAADYIKMSTSWLKKQLKDVPHFHLGTRLLFNKEDLDSWRLNKTAKTGRTYISPVKGKVTLKIAE